MEIEKKTVLLGSVSSSDIEKWQTCVEKDEEDTKAIILRALSQSEFQTFMQNTDIQSSAIVGIISKSLAAVIGGKSQIVLFSNYTATKEKNKHKDISMEHLLGLQVQYHSLSQFEEII